MKKPLCAVVGGSGFLGIETVPQMQTSFQVVATSRRPRAGYQSLDIRDHVAVQRFVDEAKPDAVVLLAAGRDPDVCEADPEETRRLNVAPAGFFAAALPPGVPLLFVSTDYVFDGQHPPYTESSPRHPVSMYGRSKMEAEDLVLARPGGVVLRVPLLIGWTHDPEQSGFFSHLLGDLRRRELLPLDHVLARYPTWTRDVGRAITTLLATRQSGVFHFSTAERLTRYQSALAMGEILGWPTDHLQPSHQIIPRKAQRPLDARLATDRWTSIGGPPATPFREVARQFLATFPHLIKP